MQARGWVLGGSGYISLVVDFGHRWQRVFFKIQGWFREVVKDTRLLLLVWWSNKGGGVIRRDLLSHGMLGLYVGTSRRERNYQIQRVFIVESAAWPATWRLFDSMTEKVGIWNQ
jgi:hypothetical protein